jgi:hypothetical protein
MLNNSKRIEWKQNRMHLSEVRIRVNNSPDEMIEFLLEEKVINYIFRQRYESIELHLNINENKPHEIFRIDFSKLKVVKPVPQLLQEGLDLKKNKSSLDNDSDKVEKIGVYSILHKNSGKWLGRDGWEVSQEWFDLIPEKTVATYINVSIKPDRAIEDGAKWRIDEGEWQESDVSVNLLPGSYTVNFKKLPDWTPPISQHVQIIEGVDENISAEYAGNEPKILTKKNISIFVAFFLVLLFIEALYYSFTAKPVGKVTADLFPSEVVEKGARWRVKNGEWQNSGKAVKLDAGDYLVEFRSIPGWQTPDHQNISVKRDDITKIDGPYIKLLHVNIKPQEVVEKGAQWKVGGDNNWQNSGEQVALKPDGPYVIAFKDVREWITPEKIDLSIQSTSVEVEYKKQPPPPPPVVDRSITIHIHPPEVEMIGARWRLEGPGNWRCSGEKITGLIDIPYKVIFKSIVGWKKPSNMKFKFDIQNNIVRDVIYEQMGGYTSSHQLEIQSISASQVHDSGYLSVRIRPAKVISEGAMWRLEGWNWQASGGSIDQLIPRLTYKVVFSDIEGWIKPQTSDVIIQECANHIEGVYVKK